MNRQQSKCLRHAFWSLSCHLLSHDRNSWNSHHQSLLPHVISGQLSRARGVSFALEMAGPFSGQGGKGQAHSWTQPCGVPLSARADSCLMPVCPWCILRASHGDEQSAMRQAELARSCIRLGPAGGHAPWIIAHALKWCQEICRRDAGDPASPTWQSEQNGAAWLQAGMGQMQPGAQPGVASRLHITAHSTTASSSSSRPHFPAPYVPPPRFARPGAGVMPMPCPTAQVVLPAPPPPPQQSYTFQVWAGNRQRWLSYEEPVQRQLNHLWARGGGEIEVTIDHHEYTIRIIPGGHMVQDRVDTERPPRKVRILELEAS